jgi:hypothetical protein
MKDILSQKLDLKKEEPSISHWCDINLFWEFYSMQIKFMSKTCREKKKKDRIIGIFFFPMHRLL